MALIVEDGTGLSTAEAYISVANADAYHEARGNADWVALTTTEKEQLLIKGADYLVQLYRGRWAGIRVNSTQALDWPRDGVWLDDYPEYLDNDYVPADIANANAIMAFKALAEDLVADQDQQIKRTAVGSLEVEYSDSARPYKQYRSVDLLLRPYLVGGNNTARLVRA